MSGGWYNGIQRVWYGRHWSRRLLLPLSGLYRAIVELRRGLYRKGVLSTRKAPAPVLVVGNLTAGGTGKTPLTVWLATRLRARGHAPGIASRGYGGSGAGTSMRVDTESDPAVVGDEPVLIARRTGCPVVVDPDRVRAAAMLCADGADLLIADDGLQHYRLARDYEICVIDGSRGLGNGNLLPAGPLREPLRRLAEVDRVLVNGAVTNGSMTNGSMTDDNGVDDNRVDGWQASAGLGQEPIRFDLTATEAIRMDGAETLPIGHFAGTTVHAVAAIGNPARFFDLLRRHGIEVIEHAFADHAAIDPKALRFDDDRPVLMTEKDAVKQRRPVSERLWYVPVDVEMDPAVSEPWLEQIETRLRERRG